MVSDKVIASQIKSQALQAIQDLARIFDISDITQFAEYELVQEAIFRAIAEIDGSILLNIYNKYPELDDLKEETDN